LPGASGQAGLAELEAALSTHVALGAAVPDLPVGRMDLPALESALGARLQITSAFVDWSYVLGGVNEVWMADGGARNVLLSWEPHGIRFTDVSSGKEDSYLQKVATSMLAYPYTLHVRPWPEMNANWSTWQPTADGGKTSGGTPAQFVAAWQYLVTFFHRRGVNNLKFVFNPDSSNWSNNTPVSSIWPGSEYVDVLGIDGYNWGNDSVGNTWRVFDSIFSNMYTTLTALDSIHPVWITETGSKEPQKEDNWLYPKESAPVDPNNNKGTWINQMMSSRLFPRVEGIVWFNKQKERDWRLESSNVSLNAIRSYLSTLSARLDPMALPYGLLIAGPYGQKKDIAGQREKSAIVVVRKL
jgi:beta-mannanase